MQRTRTRTALVTTIAATAAIAAAAFAPTAIAGGSGDFYKTRSCAVNSAGTASLVVTNYDIATGQRYHLDMDSPSGYPVTGLYIDGVKQPGWNDVYKDFADRGSIHLIRGDWKDGTFGNRIYCTFTL